MLENENLEIPLEFHQNMKYLYTNLTKYMLHLYMENYKTLLTN